MQFRLPFIVFFLLKSTTSNPTPIPNIPSPSTLTQVYHTWWGLNTELNTLLNSGIPLNHTSLDPLRQYAKPFSRIARLLSNHDRYSMKEEELIRVGLMVLDTERGTRSVSEWTAEGEENEEHLKDVLAQAWRFKEVRLTMISDKLPSNLNMELPGFQLMPTSRKTTISELVKEFDVGFNGGPPLAFIIPHVTYVDKDGGFKFHEWVLSRVSNL
jgi:hypothetical protein